MDRLQQRRRRHEALTGRRRGGGGGMSRRHGRFRFATGGGDGDEECAGVAVVDQADCTAQSCRSCVAVSLADCIALGCCPCAVVSLLGLAFVKLPLAVARRCARRLRRRQGGCSKRSGCATWTPQRTPGAAPRQRGGRVERRGRRRRGGRRAAAASPAATTRRTCGWSCTRWAAGASAACPSRRRTRPSGRPTWWPPPATPTAPPTATSLDRRDNQCQPRAVESTPFAAPPARSILPCDLSPRWANASTTCELYAMVQVEIGRRRSSERHE